jgi:hypothetical protein
MENIDDIRIVMRNMSNVDDNRILTITNDEDDLLAMGM